MIDKIIINFDKILKNITQKPKSQRIHPDYNVTKDNLTNQEKKQVIKLMRINHCGEVCAQALYQGQAIFANDKEKQKVLEKAALEEIDHLAWTKQRLEELNGNPSIFNPFFYILSLIIGMIAGLKGDKISLGFLAETEKQVANHLKIHLKKLPTNDLKSSLILNQMLIDELSHKNLALEQGGVELSDITKKIMTCGSKIMTSLTSLL